jgi:hypothetical protein
MAGSFGYKTEYYDLSLDVGSELESELADIVGNGAQLTVSGTSCLEQLDSLLDVTPIPPIPLLDLGPED